MRRLIERYQGWRYRRTFGARRFRTQVRPMTNEAYEFLRKTFKAQEVVDLDRAGKLEFKIIPEDAFNFYAVPMIQAMAGEVLAVEINDSSRVVHVTILLAARSHHRIELLEALTAWQRRFEIDLHPTILDED